MTHRSDDMSDRLLLASTGSLPTYDRLRVDDREMPGRQPEPKEGLIMSENPTQDTQDTQDNAVVNTENGAQEQTDTQEQTDVQPDVNTEAADAAVQTVEEGTVEETDAPTVEELLLKDHKQKVLGKDRISKSQMQSYREFLTHDPESGDELASPLQHPLIADLLADYDAAMWGRIAKQGKSALGEKAKEVDDAYCDMWEEWRDQQANRPPKSHKWLKGAVAAALLIAESIGEMEQEQWTTPVPQPGEEGEAVATAEAKDEALAEGATPETPEQEQPVTPEEPTAEEDAGGPDSDTRDQEGREEEPDTSEHDARAAGEEE